MDDQVNDRSGVTWGSETPRARSQERLKNTKGFSSFHLKGITYREHDTVFLRASDGPPRVAKIISMYENVLKKEKYMCVRWFLRSCELPPGIAGVIRKADSKEIFMSWNSGSKHVVSPASTIGKCNVLCTSPLPWNTPPPTTAMIAAADFVFSYAFDTKSLKVTSLQLVVKQFGESYCKDSSPGATMVSERNVGSTRKALEPGIKLEAKVIDRGKRHPARVSGPNVVADGQKSVAELIAVAKKIRRAVGFSDPSSEPGILGKPRVADSSGLDLGLFQRPRLADSFSPNSELEIFKRQRLTGSFSPNLEPGSFKRSRVADSSGPTSESGILKQRKVTNPSSAGLSERPKNISSIYKPNVAKTVEVAGMEILDNEVKRRQKPDAGVTPNPPVPKFLKMPWHKALEIALEKRKVLRLQNLDPWFSSSEIEAMLAELLGVSCDARILPPKDFSSFTSGDLVSSISVSTNNDIGSARLTLGPSAALSIGHSSMFSGTELLSPARILCRENFSGEALVLFQSQVEADDALAKFTENVLIWSEDQRPVVASVACKQRREINRARGFLDLDKYSMEKTSSMQKESGGATSQCAQPNTVAFEMGMQWRLLQERHTAVWNLAAQQRLGRNENLKVT